ncbi:ATP-binding protein [Blastococcus sp. TBT05-19]|nr:ATP-binding protein [Blastococcus sp. TBT05-19]
MSGLPGTGKSAVAGAFATRSGWTSVSVDPIEDALLRGGFPASEQTGVAAYEVARAVVEQNLDLGRSVVVDAVNDSEPARDTWRAAARDGSGLAFVLLVLEDEREHRRRLEGRRRTLTDVPEPTWAEVTERSRTYEPWPGGDVLRVDAARPVDEIVGALLARFAPDHARSARP